VIEYSAGLPEAPYTVITPYLVPPGPKKVNVGDGFILDSATKLLGARPMAAFTSRAPLTDADIERINASRVLVAVGANTLKDDFELTPRFDLATLERIKVPVVLMGVGHYGVADVTRGLTAFSQQLFRAFLERFPFMSVRCDASRRYVLGALPDLAERVLMTSCPVAHSVDGIDRGFQRKAEYDQIVVTITDRAYIEAQLPIVQDPERMSPSTRPSIWTSPVEVNVPTTTRSVEMIEGAALPRRRCCCGTGKLSEDEWPLLPLVNITPRLEELDWIAHHAIEPHFVVTVGPGAASARSHQRNTLTELHEVPRFDKGCLKMSVTGVDSMSMVDLNHEAIWPAPFGRDHPSRRRHQDRRAELPGQIRAGMVRYPPGKGIDAITKAAGQPVETARHRRHERDSRQCGRQTVEPIIAFGKDGELFFELVGQAV